MRKLKLLCLIIEAILRYKKAIYVWQICYDSGKPHHISRDDIVYKYEHKIIKYVTEFVWGE